jgi:hypothetical protein
VKDCRGEDCSYNSINVSRTVWPHLTTTTTTQTGVTDKKTAATSGHKLKSVKMFVILAHVHQPTDTISSVAVAQ